LSPSSNLPLLAITNPPGRRSLCDSWATCLCFYLLLFLFTLIIYVAFQTKPLSIWF